MKNIYLIILSIVISILSFSCSIQEDSLKTQVPVIVEEPKYANMPAFHGSVLGTNVYYEDKKDLWRNTVGFEFKSTDPNKDLTPLYITPKLYFDKAELTGTAVKGKGFGISFPSILTVAEINDVHYIIKNVINKGEKKLLYEPTLPYPGNIDKFVFAYSDRDASVGKNISVSTMWGRQEGSIFEIVSSSEVEKAPFADVIKSFLITFKIDCKMYEKDGKYAGNINGLLTYRWDYRLMF